MAVWCDEQARVHAELQESEPTAYEAFRFRCSKGLTRGSRLMLHMTALEAFVERQISKVPNAWTPSVDFGGAVLK